MKQDIQNIVEGNKAISKFMEYEQHGRQEWEYTYWMIEGKSYREDELKYHSSWDWLMPVVEKIEDLRYCTEVSLFSCFIMAGDLLDSEMVIESHSNSKIKATYEAVVQFIQWYNNQQKQVKE